MGVFKTVSRKGIVPNNSEAQISKIGCPFDVVYYVHWWMSGSRRKHHSWSENDVYHMGVDCDGGYEECQTIEEAEEVVATWQLEHPDYIYAVVASLSCTVKIIHPKKKHVKKSK